MENQMIIKNLSERIMDPSLPEDLRKAIKDTLEATQQDMFLTKEKIKGLKSGALNVHHIKLNGVPITSIKTVEYENPIKATSLYTNNPVSQVSTPQKVTPTPTANNNTTEENDD
jgi:hypothetical protein